MFLDGHTYAIAKKKIEVVVVVMVMVMVVLGYGRVGGKKPPTVDIFAHSAVPWHISFTLAHNQQIFNERLKHRAGHARL